jgi:drug/metabolite transporter (DMT)-like permease
MTTAHAPANALPGRDVLTYFALFILLVGGAPVAMRIGFAELPPFWLGLNRFGLGALAFWLLALMRGLKVPKGRALAGTILYGTLGMGVSFILLAWGLTETPASLAAILMALVPLMTVVLAFLQGAERLSARGVIGALLAAAGIAVSVGGAAQGDVSMLHIAAIVMGTFFLAQSGIVIKTFPPTPPIMTNAVAMTVGALILGGASILRGEAWVIPTMSSTWAAVGYLVVFVSVLAFLFYMQVLTRWSASGTSYAFVLMPLVTVVVAALLTGEQIGPIFLLGTALVLAGVYVGALMPSREKPAKAHEMDMTEACKDASGQVVSRCI